MARTVGGQFPRSSHWLSQLIAGETRVRAVRFIEDVQTLAENGRSEGRGVIGDARAIVAQLEG